MIVNGGLILVCKILKHLLLTISMFRMEYVLLRSILYGHNFYSVGPISSCERY